jgi:hypothetical protein
MKTLIAVNTCHKDSYKEKAAAERSTWVKDAQCDVVFFKGHSPLGGPTADEVWLDVPDTYEHLRLKSAAMFRWALQHSYDYCWKIDDDVYARPERLLAVEPTDYCGAVAPLAPPKATSYFAMFPSKTVYACLGWVYRLSERSMVTLLSEADRPNYNRNEDIWIGQKLCDNGINPVHLEGRIKKPNTHGVPNGWPHQMPPHPNNEVMASCEYTGQQMLQVHEAWSNRIPWK